MKKTEFPLVTVIIPTRNEEKYIEGVVETESGPNAPFEYYKSQAIICRTYALGHFDRHIKEEFNLCDGVHCQAYKGRSMANDSIPLAVHETSGLVIVDTSLNPITAAFHSNSGGHTINSEDVWSKETSYLKAIIDTFAVGQNNYLWKDSISVKEWKKYLDTIGFEISEDSFTNHALNFEQKKRKIYFYLEKDSIALKKIRQDFGLRSTFFSFKPKDKYIIINGKGYGHGVGLCQEGAMEMARKGYSFKEIINFYYTGVMLFDVGEMELIYLDN